MIKLSKIKNKKKSILTILKKTLYYEKDYEEINKQFYQMI